MQVYAHEYAWSCMLFIQHMHVFTMSLTALDGSPHLDFDPMGALVIRKYHGWVVLVREAWNEELLKTGYVQFHVPESWTNSWLWPLRNFPRAPVHGEVAEIPNRIVYIKTTGNSLEIEQVYKTGYISIPCFLILDELLAVVPAKFSMSSTTWRKCWDSQQVGRTTPTSAETTSRGCARIRRLRTKIMKHVTCSSI